MPRRCEVVAESRWSERASGDEASRVKRQGKIDRELGILLADYQATREDDRQALVREVAIISAGVALFAAYYYLLTVEDARFIETRPLLLAAMPLAPYLVA